MKYFLFIALLFVSSVGFGQDASQINVPKMVPVSPNAASLGIYGAIPVGHYTGVPNISIPIYEIDLDGKKFPINISYHASGIKVAQEASTVGLGWALNAGGCITKEVHGWDDFSYVAPLGYYYDKNFPAADANNDLDITVGTLADRHITLVQYNANDKDPEPDLYHFNFGSYSETAFFEKIDNPNLNSSIATPVTRNGKDKLDIKRFTTKSAYNEYDYWIITDVDGYKYYFNTSELTTNYWQESQVWRLRPIQPTVISTWYLDSIVSPYGNKIAFSYEFDNIQTPISSSEDISYLLAAPLGSDGVFSSSYRTFTESYARINQALLKQIVFKNGTVMFDYTERNDIKPVNEANKARKLSKISINNNSNTLRNILFKHSYLGYSVTNQYLEYRLMLDTLSVGSEESSIQDYVFSYNKTPLPSKESLQVDYWGYYNSTTERNEGHFGIAPSALINYEAYGNNQTRFFKGRDRRSDTHYIQNGMLHTIKYPTGGTTSFTYELNEFTNAFPWTNPITPYLGTAYYYFYDEPWDEDGARNQYSEDFTVEANTKARISINHYLLYTGKYADYSGVCTMPSNIIIQKKDANGDYSYVKHVSITSKSGSGVDTYLFEYIFSSQGTYRIKIDPQVFDMEADIYVSIRGDYQPEDISCGGGLRIQQITDNFSTDQSSTKKYYYRNSIGNSSGLLMTKPELHCVYAKKGQLLSGTIVGGNINGTLSQGYGLYFGGFSSPFRPFGYSAMGSNVGYSYVEEIIEKGGQNNGKTIYTFHNTEDDLANLGNRFIKGFPTIPHLDNGNPISIISKNSEGVEIKKDSFEYKKIDGISLKGLKFMNTPTEMVTNLIDPDGGYDVDWEHSLIDNVAFKFYDLFSECWQLSKQTTSELLNNQWITTATEYGYNDENWLPNYVKTSDSNNRTIERSTLFSADTNTAMKTKGILSAVTEQSEKSANQPTQKIITDYKNWGNNLFAPEFIQGKRTKIKGSKVVLNNSYHKRL